MNTDKLLLSEKQARFARICEQTMREKHEMGEAGIGTLAEKRLHLIIKRFLCEDEDYHEVGVLNTRYVSDVKVGNDVFEVQTGDLYPLRNKLHYYIEHTACTVTVVHPIPVKRWVSWIDPKNGSISERTRVPRRGKPEDILPQLYSLIPLLGEPRLRFRLLCIESQDFRTLTNRTRNRKLGAKKYERIPLALIDDIELSSPLDFLFMVPKKLPQHFTVKEFSTHSGIHGRDAYSAVRVLCALGIFAPSDPIGNSMGFVRRFM